MTNYRKFAVAGVSAAALALAACTPPNENPSDQKVETGNTFEAPRSSEPTSTNGTSTQETGVAGTNGTDSTGESVRTTETIIGGTESDLDDDEDSELAAASGDSATGSSGATKTTSSRKVAANKIGFINCLGSPERKPAYVVLDCADPDERLTKIKWTSWESDSAKASAQNTDNQEVSLVLRSPVESAQGTVFSEILVDGQLVTP
ncbi:hypothetical protein [Corynebacterium pseudodiphtheriticum]|uniref:hypothetical protein n=1 Tax=Corynebacterium pseudodiphtheriticum TaxID=37637 RepID=UPI00234CA9CA|nr:hypothetical protein [Corynebacterium pseudodiphtheriticum]MDC7088524.1 hypothetical protein [Corynebacterium pseudodiphtheriticum]MDK4241138.1 hypothetical protein [Corynebacterium pseudodiphtheriticum]MDK4320827.1 hypothetical protein [Corynebacterium pseudodiphtheriticum]